MNQLSVEARGEDLGSVIAGKSQETSAIPRVPNGRVVHIRVFHFCRGSQQLGALQIGADLNDSSALQCEVGLAFTLAAIDGKAPWAEVSTSSF